MLLRYDSRCKKAVDDLLLTSLGILIVFSNAVACQIAQACCMIDMESGSVSPMSKISIR